MRSLYRITLGAAGTAFALGLYWRFATRRHPVPCPARLSWLLENPFMNSVAGADTILDRLAVQPGMKVLDVGCGPGRLTVPTARQVGNTGIVVALDIQPAMLRRVQDKLDQAKLTNVRLVLSGAGEGKVEHDAFDRALLVTVLGEIPDRKAALAEIFQALKPGGILSVTEVLPDPDYQRPGTVRHLASEAGFEEQAYFDGFPAYTIHLRKPDDHAPAKIKVEGLSNVSTTLLIPLYMRALESHCPNPLLIDTKAAELINQLDYDFSRLKQAAFSRVFPLLRMREIDGRVGTFLAEYPEGTVVDIGCGFDTRFYRVDNGKMTWYDLDLPEVMTIRDQLLGESPNRHSIPSSALDLTWTEQIGGAGDKRVLFLAEGVLSYFEQQEVKRLVVALCKRFPGAELVFDALPPGFVRWMRWHPALRATKARLGWGIEDGLELEHWHPGIRLMSQWFYFEQAEPRLRWYKLLKWFAPLGKARIVQYKLGRQE